MMRLTCYFNWFFSKITSRGLIWLIIIINVINLHRLVILVSQTKAKKGISITQVNRVMRLPGARNILWPRKLTIFSINFFFYHSRWHRTKKNLFKFGETFCDWLIYETAHAQTPSLTH